MSKSGSVSAASRRVAILVGACTVTGAFAAAPALALASSPYDLTAFAGTGTAHTEVAGPATSSPLDLPYGAAVDSSGNVYIADLLNYTVDKVTANGTLSVIAGTPGVSGNPTTPGAAVGNHLVSPTGVAVGPDGTVYLADYDASTVYKIATDGTLSVLAGTGAYAVPTPGPAASSALKEPYDVAVDPSGNVYIADTYNDLIEKVTPGGTLSVFAGMAGVTGAATAGAATSSAVAYPEGIATDAAGNVYVASYGSSEILKITPAGALTVIAGTSAGNGPETVGPATSSQLSSPGGVAVDGAGDVYVADSGNHRVEEITPNGNLSIIAGSSATGAPTYGVDATTSPLDTPQSIASSPAGKLYIVDEDHNTVETLTPPAPVSVTAPTVSGTVAIGDTLTSDEGTWQNVPIVYAYQWEDCDSSGVNCSTITGATASSYTPVSSDAGHTVRVTVTASNGGGAAASTSATGQLIPAPPTVTTPTTTTPTTTTPVTTTPVTTTTTPIITPTPPIVAACPLPSGSLSDGRLGRLSLGMTRSSARKLMPDFTVTANTFDNFCLAGGFGVRVAYPSSSLLKRLGRSEREEVNGRIVVALTANPFYTIEGITHGTTLAAAKDKLTVGPGYRIGRNTWYVITVKKFRYLLKIQGGIVQEIGVANATLTATSAAQRALLNNL